MVSSPLTASSPSDLLVIAVDSKLRLGNFSTSRKSALLRCASRCPSPVWIEAASIEALTVDAVMSCSSKFKVPVSLVNCPFRFEIIMCLTLNSATEWAGSRFQVLTAVCGTASVLIFILLLGNDRLDALSRYSFQQIYKPKKLADRAPR